MQVKNKGIDYVISLKSKRLYNSIFSLQHTAFLNNIKLFSYKMRIKFYKNALVVEQNKQTTKIVNADGLNLKKLD